MRLIPKWKITLKRSWTVWLGVLTALLNGLMIAVGLYTGTFPVAPMSLIIINGVLGALVPLLRVIDQNIEAEDADK